jgi:nucleoside-diphosphate-sugar epimerase
MADVLVTGAAGLLGSRLLDVLVDQGHEVSALVRRMPDAPAPGVGWVVHDLRRPDVASALPERVDVVVHLAQARSFRQFPETAPEVFAVNVGSTALLLDWAYRAGVGQFVLASTGSVYTEASAHPHREDERVDVPALASFYAASKMAAELLAGAYRAFFPVVILRPFTIYGPGQHASMLVPRLVDAVRSGKPVQVAGRDGLHVNPIWVGDAAQAVASTLRLDESTVVNVAGPEVVSVRQMANWIGGALGVPARFEPVEGVPDPAVIGDTSRMAALLGPPVTKFVEVVDELCTGSNDYGRPG